METRVRRKLNLKSAYALIRAKNGQKRKTIFNMSKNRKELLEFYKRMNLQPIPDKGCQYIYGDVKSRNYKWCNKKRKDGSRYCETHHELCYVPNSTQRKENERSSKSP